jgi:ABC-2 type transport system permease protein
MPIPANHTQLRRYAAIYAALWRNSVVREMGFKTNFLLWVVVELLWFGLQLGFIAVIYLHTTHVGDWTQWQVVALIGAAHFIQQVFHAFFLSNITQISEYIRTGKLDFMLLLPVNTRFLLSMRQVDLGGFISATSAAAIIVYALYHLNYVPSPPQILGFLFLAAAGVLIHYSLMFWLACASFWTVRAQSIVWGYYSMFNIARMPDAAFRGAFKVLFTFAIPMLLVANVPSKLLLAKLSSPLEMIWLLVMCIACFVMSELTWRVSLRHYTSASS